MGITKTTIVKINDIKFPFNTAFTWDTPPGPIEEEVTLISDAYPRRIKIQDGYAEGTIEFRAVLKEGSNDPLDVMDGFLRTSYSYYDTTTSRVVHSSVKYDWSYEEDGALGVPKKPFEFRQVEATADTAVQSDSDDKIAFSFIAGGDLLKLFRFKAREDTDGEVTAFNLEIWSDNSGSPGAKLAGTNTLNITGIDPADGADYTSADWITVDFETNDILGSATLTKGTKYWLVIDSVDTDELYVSYTGNNRYADGDVYTYDGSWAQVSGATPTYIIQFYNTYGGHNIRVRTYDGSNYIEYFCEGCDVWMPSPDVGPQRSIIFRMKFRTNKVTLTKNIS